MIQLIKPRSVAYRAVILAVLMMSSVAVVGVGAATSHPVSLDAADWQTTSASTVTNNVTNGGIDVALIGNGESAFSTVQSTGQMTIYYDASIDGVLSDLFLKYYEPGSPGVTTLSLASWQEPSKTGSYVIDVAEGSTISVYLQDPLLPPEARVTLSTTPLDGPTNSPPEAVLSAPASAVQGDPITLDASGSSDPDGDALTYAWDLDGDGAYDDATGATVQHSFADAGVQTVSVEVSDGTDTDTADATIEVAYAAPLDVKPGSDDNPVNPNSEGVLPVAILNTDDFDPTAVVVESLVLSATEGGDGASSAHGGHFEDVDGDGDEDLLVHFPSADLGIDTDTAALSLSGEMADGLSLVGSDDVTVVGNNGSSGNGNGNARGR